MTGRFSDLQHKVLATYRIKKKEKDVNATVLFDGLFYIRLTNRAWQNKHTYLMHV